MSESTLNGIGGENFATNVGDAQKVDPTLVTKRTDGDVGGVPTLVSGGYRRWCRTTHHLPTTYPPINISFVDVGGA